jgi:hypothetical protein
MMGKSKPNTNKPYGKSYLKELESQAAQKQNLHERDKLAEKNREMETIYKSKIKHEQVNLMIVGSE